MLKGFIKRIVAEVIKELISPELTAIREELKKETSLIWKELSSIREEIKEMKEDIRHLDRRLDDLYKVVVRREEHYSLEEDVKKIRDDVEMLKRKVSV